MNVVKENTFTGKLSNLKTRHNDETSNAEDTQKGHVYDKKDIIYYPLIPLLF
jgi:hypothetical protein